jgi:hypothetical protein
VVVNAPPGISVSGYGTTGTALRGRQASALAPALATPADCSVVGTTTTCALPAVPAGAALDMHLELAIAPDAEAGSLTLQVGSVSTTIDISIAAGITDLTVGGPHGPIGVGTPTPITLTPELADGVTEAGPITMPTKSGGIWVTQYPNTCTGSTGILTCVPEVDETGGITYGPITVTVMPDATPDDALHVTVPHGDDGGIAIIGGDSGTPIQLPGPDDPVHLTGRYSAATMTVATLACPKPGQDDRGTCGMVPVTGDAVVRTVEVPSEATVVWARLTLVAGTLVDPAPTPVLLVNGDKTPLDALTRIDCGESCPVVRYTDVTRALARGGQVQVVDIGADRGQPRNRPLPMEGWTLTVAWTDPKSTVTIDYRNGVTSSESAPDGAVTTLAEAGAPLVSLDVAGWAFDPVAEKSVVTLNEKGRPQDTLVKDLTGRSGCQSGPKQTECALSGVQPIHVAPDPKVDSTRAIGLVNRQTDSFIDALWIGTTVVVRSVPDSVPPAS